MDVLADFLSVAGMVAHLDESLSGGKTWVHQVASIPRSSPTMAVAAQRLSFYAVVSGQIRFTSAAAEHSLNSGDTIFAIEGQEHRLESRSEDTRVTTGQIEFTSGSIGLSVLNLASTIIVRSNDESLSSELVRRLGTEIEEQRGGWKSVSLGIVNALFIAALRSGGTCSKSNSESNGWLRAMADDEIGAALKLMHERPEHRWTVAELANELSVSRSAFAARFKTITGRPPLEYLTWWRLQRAAARLRTGDVTLTEVTRNSGYQSEAAFGKAFRREFGISPGQLRRQAKAKSHTSSQLQLELKKRDPFTVPEQEAGLNLIKTAEWMQEPFISLLNQHGLFGSLYNILRILRGKGIPQAQDELLNQLLLPEDDIQSLVDQLVSAQLVSVSHPNRMLSITEAGTQLLSKLDSPILALHRRQLSHFSEGELAEFNRLLVKARNPAG